MMTVTLYEQVVEVTTNYLGPTAKRFVFRQVSIHLGKSVKDLKQEDLPMLADWSKIALGLVSNDRQEVDRFHEDLLKLAH